jgi:hypothetical protein
MMRAVSILAVVGLVACGGKDGYVADTSPAMTGATGCPYTDIGGAFEEFPNAQDCTLCPSDWVCQTYENFNSTKCFLPCENQAECDECAPGSTCEVKELGASGQPARICDE